MAAQAFAHANEQGNTGMIGTCFLLSKENEYFPFSVHCMHGSLFLKQEESFNPKCIAYTLNTLFAVTQDTYMYPTVRHENKHAALNSFQGKKTMPSGYYSAKIVCNNGVHRRLFFPVFETMCHVLEQIA